MQGEEDVGGGRRSGGTSTRCVESESEREREREREADLRWAGGGALMHAGGGWMDGGTVQQGAVERGVVAALDGGVDVCAATLTARLSGREQNSAAR